VYSSENFIQYKAQSEEDVGLERNSSVRWPEMGRGGIPVRNANFKSKREEELDCSKKEGEVLCRLLGRFPYRARTDREERNTSEGKGRPKTYSERWEEKSLTSGLRHLGIHL